MRKNICQFVGLLVFFSPVLFGITLVCYTHGPLVVIGLLLLALGVAGAAAGIMALGIWILDKCDEIN